MRRKVPADFGQRGLEHDDPTRLPPSKEAGLQLARDIAAEWGYEVVEVPTPPGLDVERLGEALHAARVGCSPDVCEPTPAFYQGVRRTMHETDARDIFTELARPPSGPTAEAGE